MLAKVDLTGKKIERGFADRHDRWRVGFFLRLLQTVNLSRDADLNFEYLIITLSIQCRRKMIPIVLTLIDWWKVMSLHIAGETGFTERMVLIDPTIPNIILDPGRGIITALPVTLIKDCLALGLWMISRIQMWNRRFLLAGVAIVVQGQRLPYKVVVSEADRDRKLGRHLNCWVGKSSIQSTNIQSCSKPGSRPKNNPDVSVRCIPQIHVVSPPQTGRGLYFAQESKHQQNSVDHPAVVKSTTQGREGVKRIKGLLILQPEMGATDGNVGKALASSLVWPDVLVRRAKQGRAVSQQQHRGVFCSDCQGRLEVEEKKLSASARHHADAYETLTDFYKHIPFVNVEVCAACATSWNGENAGRSRRTPIIVYLLL